MKPIIFKKLDNKVDIGYYYSEVLKIVMVGFIKNGRLYGKVIKDKNYSYGIGYKSDSWKNADFKYLGSGNPASLYIALEKCEPYKQTFHI